MAFGTTNRYIVYEVYANEDSWDKASNTSVIHMWVDVWRTNSGYSTYGNGSVTVWCDGQSYTANITSAQRITSTPIRILDAYFRVGHNADGSKTIWVSGQISHDRFSSGNNGYNKPLTKIPRQANITWSSDFTDKDNPTIHFSNPGGFNMDVWLEPNPNGPHLAERNNIPNTGSYTWTLSEEERKQLREACKGRTCTIRLGLYSNNKTWVSYNDRTFTMVDAFPSFDEVVAEPVDPFGKLYLQGKSKAKITINGAKGIYGSTITSYTISGGDYNYNGKENTYTTGLLSKPGNIEFTATITDSRGFTASKKININVTEYTFPSLTMTGYRSTSDGIKDLINGNYITIIPHFDYCDIEGNSIVQKSLLIDDVPKSYDFENDTPITFGTYGLDSKHKVLIRVTDAVGNDVINQLEIDIAKITFQIPIHKNGLGIGRYVTKEGELQIGYDTNIFGVLLINNEEQPVFQLVETLDIEIGDE